MKISSPTLYLEINITNFIFFVRGNDGQNNFKTIYKLKTKLEGITNDRISDVDKISDVIKENIYAIEKKLDYTFKEIIVILENFNPKFDRSINPLSLDIDWRVDNPIISEKDKTAVNFIDL